MAVAEDSGDTRVNKFRDNSKMVDDMLSELDLRKDAALSELLGFLKQAGYHFVTPTPATHHRVNQRIENRLARSLTDAFGWNRSFRKELLPEAIFDALAARTIITGTSDGWKSAVRASTIGAEIFLP